MRGALLTVAALCASAAAAPLSAPSLQHSLSISLSPEYEAMLLTDSALEASFNLVAEESLGAFLDAEVNVVGITTSAEASVHRRAQASDSVTINYIVKCGADGCLDEKAKLTNMDTTQMGNIMQAIDDHAFSTGFGTSAVRSRLKRAAWLTDLYIARKLTMWMCTVGGPCSATVALWRCPYAWLAHSTRVRRRTTSSTATGILYRPAPASLALYK